VRRLVDAEALGVGVEEVAARAAGDLRQGLLAEP